MGKTLMNIQKRIAQRQTVLAANKLKMKTKVRQAEKKLATVMPTSELDPENVWIDDPEEN